VVDHDRRPGAREKRVEWDVSQGSIGNHDYSLAPNFLPHRSEQHAAERLAQSAGES